MFTFCDIMHETKQQTQTNSREFAAMDWKSSLRSAHYDMMIDANAAITLLEKRLFSGLFSSIVMAAFTSIIISTFNCYCWTSIIMKCLNII